MQRLEPTVLGRLYRQHAPGLLLYARQWGPQGDDLVQDAFLRLARQAPPPERPLPWLYAVVRNEGLAAQRSAARRRQREQRASVPEVWFQTVADRLEGDEATRLLAALPLALREVVVARVWGGLTFEDIARLVGCSLPTAHRRFRAGLSELRERLEGQWTPTTPTT